VPGHPLRGDELYQAYYSDITQLVLLNPNFV
jgi:hypothetical protein